MVLLVDADGIRKDRLLVLDAIVRRQTTLRLAARHAPARDGEADADLGRRVDLIVHLAAILEHVSVVEDRGAARACQLRAADQDRGAGILGRARRPDAVMHFEPGEEVGDLAGGQVAR